MRLFGLITLALVAMAVIAITPVLSQNMKEPTVTKDQSGMGEGIKVHGDWEVKVTDPETGSEEIYAFSNDFIEEQGSNVLALSILGEVEGQSGVVHKYDPNNWKIAGFIGYTEAGVTKPSLCIGPDNADIELETEAPNSKIVWKGYTPKLRLTDECVSEVDGFIYRVFTAYDHPAYSLTMKDDLTGTNTIFAFTTRQLQNSEGNDGGIEVKKGQKISLDVLISFE